MAPISTRKKDKVLIMVGETLQNFPDSTSNSVLLIYSALSTLGLKPLFWIFFLPTRLYLHPARIPLLSLSSSLLFYLVMSRNSCHYWSLGSSASVRLLFCVSHLSCRCVFFFFCLFAISWAAPIAYEGSQARGLIGAVAASLHQGDSNAGSKLCLRPTPQLKATPDS